MHTWEITDDEHQVWTIHHNGDHSGDAIIIVPEGYKVEVEDRRRWDEATQDWPACQEFRIPARVLANYGRGATIDDIISKLEQWDGGEL